MDAIKLFVMNNALSSQAIIGIKTNKVVFTALYRGMLHRAR